MANLSNTKGLNKERLDLIIEGHLTSCDFCEHSKYSSNEVDVFAKGIFRRCLIDSETEVPEKFCSSFEYSSALEE